MLKSRSVQWMQQDCHNQWEVTVPANCLVHRNETNRRIRRMALSAAVAVALTGWAMPQLPIQAQQAAGTMSGTAAAAVPSALVNNADLFLHYSLLGKEQLAKNCGQAFLAAKPSPVDALHAFEAAAHGRNVSEILIGNQQNKPLKKVSAEISALLEKGHLAVARNPGRIIAAIKAMVESPRAYYVSRQRLRAAGEFAAPFFIQFLNSPSDTSYGPTIIRMMCDLGKPLINPLVRQLATPSTPEKIEIVRVLGHIGYLQALPYLKAIATDRASAPDLKKAADAAISRICKLHPTADFSQMSASELFLLLAESYYHNAPSVAANHPNEVTNPVWYYDAGLNNVVGVPVPTPIWKDIETMRACEAALKLNPDNSAAISLWLAAAMRREINLPAGATDPTIKAGQPMAHYYAVAAGPRYLNPVLSLALQADNSPLVLKTIQALQQTGGVECLVGKGNIPSPLVEAIAYPDPAVRFEAASALALANPAKAFVGSTQVVPVLAEAVAQSTKPVAILVNSDIQIRNEMKARLRADYRVIDAPTVAQAVTRSIGVPYIGLVILPGKQAAEQYQQYAATDYLLRDTPTLVMGSASELPALHAEFVNDPTIEVIPTGATEQTVQQSYRDIMAALGSQPINAEQSTAFALRAAHELRLMAMNRACIYDVNKAMPALKLAMQSSDNKVLIAVAEALGQIRNPEAQKLLAHAALNSASAPVPVRTALYMSLAQSARNLGNHLDSADIDALIHEVAHESDATVRSAAAESLGALNVASNQASKLILKQAR